MQEDKRMERAQMKEQENGSTKTYWMLQAALAAVSLITIAAGSIYYEKYTEEIITSLIVTLVLGAVYGRALRSCLEQWKEILLVHVLMMAVITAGFLMDGFLKPVAFAPVIIGSFLLPEAGLAAAVFYGVTAVLYTMETGEILMLYLLVAGVGIYFLKGFLQDDRIVKKAAGVILLFAVQTAGAVVFGFYMYLDIGIATAAIGGAILAVLTGIFSFVMPMLSGDSGSGRKEQAPFEGKKSKTEKAEKQEGRQKDKKQKEKKPAKNLLLDESSELFGKLKANHELYQHSLTVAQIAEKAAASIDADRLLVRAGAMYHDIGKLAGGEDYVAEGAALCRESQVPASVVRLVEEHNVNYKAPTSKEAAAVMLADTIVSTMEFNRKKGKETNSELLVEKIFKIRKEKGALERCGLSEIELELMEEAMKKEVSAL